MNNKEQWSWLPGMGLNVVSHVMEAEGGQNSGSEQDETDWDEVLIEDIVWSFIF